jgi:ornithine carbamoyltransferase
MKSYLTELDLSVVETKKLLRDAMKLKSKRAKNVGKGVRHDRDDLHGRHVALYFEKPSVRTRVSFTIAVHELGGAVVELGPSTTKVGKGEDIADFAAVIGRYAALLVARTFAQATLETMVAYAGIPVINALSDERHPCQALADVMTIIERKGRMADVKIAFIGEGNNVAASLGLLGAALGAHVVVASPKKHGLPPAILERATGMVGRLDQVESVDEAISEADVLYTDTWVSMGQEAEAAQRRSAFRGYKIDAALVARAKKDVMVMHCLPAVRGEEIDPDVMYGDTSAIWDQAENRLHVQKALLRRLLD